MIYMNGSRESWIRIFFSGMKNFFNSCEFPESLLKVIKEKIRETEGRGEEGF